MFKFILLITFLVSVSNVYSNPGTAGPLTATPGYVYGLPQGANFNQNVGKTIGQQNGAVPTWPSTVQYPRINALSNGYAYNTGLAAVSSLAAPGHPGYQLNQGHYMPYNTGFNAQYYPNPNIGYVKPAGYYGAGYNRPYYPTIQHN